MSSSMWNSFPVSTYLNGKTDACRYFDAFNVLCDTTHAFNHAVVVTAHSFFSSLLVQCWLNTRMRKKYSEWLFNFIFSCFFTLISFFSRFIVTVE